MSIAEIVPYATRGYGAVELKEVYQRNMSRGLSIAIVIVASVVGSYYVSRSLEREELTPPIIVLKLPVLGPPPSIIHAGAHSVAIAHTSVKPSNGFPVPIPDVEVNPEKEFATQQELSLETSPVTEGITGGSVLAPQPEVDIDVPPPDFVPYQKEPTIVKKVDPRYPEVAIRAGIEGNVVVKMWVTKEGKVKEAVILRSDADIFNLAAKDAAMQWVFTPALMQNGPVAVWVSIPFRFRLTGK